MSLVSSCEYGKRYAHCAPLSLQLLAQERADMNLAQVLYAEGILYACGEYHGHPLPRAGQNTPVDVAMGRMRWRS